MIVRVLTATVRIEQAGQFNHLLRTQLPILREQPGLRYVKLARRLREKTEEVVLFEEWIDLPSMYAWTGPDVGVPRLVPGAEGLLDHLVITHYEALDMDPPPGWTGLPAGAHAMVERPRRAATEPSGSVEQLEDGRPVQLTA